MNTSDRFAEALMDHSISLARFESHEKHVALKLLRDLEAQLLAELRQHAVDEPTLRKFQFARVEKLLAYVKPIIATAYADLLRESRRELQKLAVTEVAMTRELGVELVVDGLFSVGVPEATLKAVVNDAVIQGKPLRDWWSRQATTTFERYGDTIRHGIVRGNATNVIVRELRGTEERQFEDGVFARSRTDVTTLVRTSVQSVANESRMEVFRANADVLRGIEFLTGLDMAVCPRCRPYSGMVYRMDGTRFPGTALPFPGTPPIHANCRCMWLPVIRAYRELSTARGPRFTSALQSVDPTTKTALDGGFGQDLSLPVWLKTQPASVQRAMLGDVRYDMWRRGTLPLSAMIHAVTGRPLRIEEIKARRRPAA